jgi:monofunctional glycosyltransferase
MLQLRIFGHVRPEYHWVPLESISPNLAIAAVAAEDQKFPYHSGFDLEAIADAFEQNQSDSGALRGGSTITQQVAKNLYLWPAQSLVRKAAEAWLTVWIELLWPKRRILEVYLNIAEFGEGIYGADAASRRAFGKPPARLTATEAARLIAVLPSPRRMSIVRPSAYVQSRSQEILAAAGALGGVGYLDAVMGLDR